jgi:putative phosphoesterase
MKQYFDYFVDGNNDFDWKKIIKFSFAGKIFLLMHGDAYYAFNAKKWHDNLRSIGIENNADIVIYGHSHIPVVDDKAKPIVVNPGSISLPRNHDLLRTYLIIEIDNNTIDFLIKSI